MRRTASAPAHVHPHASAPDAGEGVPRRTDGRDPAGAAGQRDTLRTEFSFQLPRGYVDEAGVVHRTGVMRLATARDELVPLRDDRVRENSAYLSVVLIARVVTRIGTIDDVHPGIIEDLFASDLAFLQDFYRRINAEGHTRAAVTCPACQEEFAVNLAGGRLGES
ncbi:hypothetical protein ABT218_06895 [Streptomyces sp. NPDC001455]|uniref:hypothetical protein n=1 Tax=unclassified Streptomyces TaxID=2593676 RepID=UPI00332B5863